MPCKIQCRTTANLALILKFSVFGKQVLPWAGMQKLSGRSFMPKYAQEAADESEEVQIS
jgi:hypothetical protein